MLRARNSSVDCDALLKADSVRRELQVKVDAIRAKKNAGAQEFARHKRAGTADSPEASGIIAEMRRLDEDLAIHEENYRQAEAKFMDLFLRVPNFPHESVPAASGEEGNVEIRRWNEPRNFDFKPLQHFEIGSRLGLIDLERAAKIAGSRFAMFTAAGARLLRALIQYMLEMHIREHGYTEVSLPILVNSESLTAAGQLPILAEDMYWTEGETKLWLQPTAEVPLLNIHRDEILDGSGLPLKYVGYLPSFRKESGSYGKDVRGLIRNHQFDKVEMFQFVKPESSLAALDEMVTHAEDVLKGLEIPFRTVLLCTGEMSFGSHKTFDLEVWLPGQNKYREISSCSTCSDFQARRARIRYREAKKGKAELVHTLNGSGIAVGRTFVAVLENYQNADGTLTIPEVLRPYFEGKSLIGPPGPV